MISSIAITILECTRQMEIDFIKLHTFSNDLILVDALRSTPRLGSLYLALHGSQNDAIGDIVRLMCSRHRGIGGNGVLFLTRGEKTDIRIRFFKPSGDESFVFSDSAIVLSRYAFDSGYFDKDKLVVEVSSGLHTIEIIDSNHFRISLGSPCYVDSDEQIIEKPDTEYTVSVAVDGKKIIVTPLRLYLNCIIFFYGNMSYKSQRHLALKIIGAFPAADRTVTVFTRVYSRDEISIKIWYTKTGRQILPVDYTAASAAAAVAAVLNGFTERDTYVHCNRNGMFAQWNQRSNRVYATSTAQYLFRGTYYLEKGAAVQNDNYDGQS
ncbi:MAG: hypothetical protein AB1798_16470 [Spirochaetota bacterium]